MLPTMLAGGDVGGRRGTGFLDHRVHGLVVLGAQAPHLVVHDAGLHGAAPGRVDEQHHGLGALVFEGRAQRRHDGVGTGLGPRGDLDHEATHGRMLGGVDSAP